MASRKQIVRAVLAGIQKAQNDYSNMAGAWAWEGAEYWITVYVARELWKLEEDRWVTVEGRSNDAMKSAGRYSGRTRHVINNKRIDIILWWGKGNRARAPIEIKKQRASDAVISDMKRIVAALKHSRMEFGIVGYFYSRTRTTRKTAKKYVEDYMNEVYKKAQSEIEANITVSHYKGNISGDEDDAWGAGCLLIQKPRQ